MGTTSGPTMTETIPPPAGEGQRDEETLEELVLEFGGTFGNLT